MSEPAKPSLPKELYDELDELHLGQQRLSRTLKEANDESTLHNLTYLNEINTHLDRICEHPDLEIRDNLLAIYSMMTRKISFDDELNYSDLKIDKAVNDIRDLIVRIDRTAKSAGLPSSEELVVPAQILVNRSEYKNELREIVTRINSIEGDIGNIKIVGNQIGLVNIFIENVDIKLTLSKLLLLAKGAIDALGIFKLLSGIARLARKAMETLSPRHPRGSETSEALIRIAEQADLASQSANQIIIDSVGHQAHDARSWRPEEIHALIAGHVRLPEDALPHLKRLELGEDQRVSDSELHRLLYIEDLRFSPPRRMDTSAFGAMKNLKRLVLVKTHGRDLTFLNDMPNLEMLEINGAQFSDRHFRMPGTLALPKLKHLGLCQIETGTLPDFSLCKSLESITFEECAVRSWQDLETAKSAKAIYFNKCDIRRLDLIADLPNLEDVYIGNVGDLTLQSLFRAPALKNIYVNYTPATHEKERFAEQGVQLVIAPNMTGRPKKVVFDPST